MDVKKGITSGASFDSSQFACSALNGTDWRG